MKKLLSVMLALSLVISLAACGGQNNGDPANPDKLVMGFVPSQDSDKIADTVQPLADKLSEELGVEVEGRVMTNYSALIEAMGSNQVQIGFIPAFGYVLAHDKHDVEVILKSERDGEDTYRAQYVVRTDSGIKSLKDLKGKTWAFADTNSTSGYLFPASQLMDEFKVKDVQAEYFGEAVQAGGHDNALITVYEGDADVATTFEDARDTLENDYPDVKKKLKVIGYTDPIPNDTISVTKGLDDELVEKIRQTFLSFNDDKEMVKIMNEVYNWDGIREAKDEDYAIVRDTFKKFEDSIELD